MIDQTTRDALEIDRLLEALAERAASTLGADAVCALEPLTDAAEIARRQRCVAEALSLLEVNSRLPLGGLTDISETLDHAEKEGSALAPDNWPVLTRHLDLVARLRRFGAEKAGDLPELAAVIGALLPNEELRHSIERVFDEDGLVRDHASPGLAEARRGLRTAEQRIRREIGNILNELRGSGVLQDDFSTLRNGRHVLPVRAGSRGRVKGIVHGSSGSGETLYIEPLSVVEAANDAELLREREAQEIHRIMLELTRALRPWVPDARANLRVLAEIDRVNALSRVAYDGGWKLPIVAEKGAVKLFFAHHPLLHLARAETSVPITIAPDTGDHVIVLSGPNAGGKTTAMKTLALNAWLAQCGAPVPASPDSRFPLFRGFYADIGDQQDLGEGLSTFSGHVRRLREILRAADDRALVLLDELGTGTDPEEGGALAQAILEDLSGRAALALATSHLGPVIKWAEETEGARNASFSLDPGTHRPTYRLRLDLPGASEALQIAENEGMPARLLERARGLVGEQKLAMGEMLRRIEDRDRRLGESLREARERAESLEGQERLARQRAEELRRERREFRREMAEEREAALREIRERVERMIADLPGEAELAQRKRGLEDLRRHVTAGQEGARREIRGLSESDASPDAAGLEPGARVYVPAFGAWGEIVRTAGKKATVLVGSIQAEVNIATLSDREPDVPKRDAGRTPENAGPAGGKKKRSRRVKAALEDAPAAPSFSGFSVPVRRSPGGRKAPSPHFSREAVPMELDLHGYRVEEALQELDRYLDRALMSDYNYVRIVHGTGQGKLYRAVHEFLRTYPPVTAFRFGTPDEGGGGVTIAEFGD